MYLKCSIIKGHRVFHKQKDKNSVSSLNQVFINDISILRFLIHKIIQLIKVLIFCKIKSPSENHFTRTFLEKSYLSFNFLQAILNSTDLAYFSSAVSNTYCKPSLCFCLLVKLDSFTRSRASSIPK